MKQYFTLCLSTLLGASLLVPPRARAHESSVIGCLKDMQALLYIGKPRPFALDQPEILQRQVPEVEPLWRSMIPQMTFANPRFGESNTAVTGFVGYGKGQNVLHFWPDFYREAAAVISSTIQNLRPILSRELVHPDEAPLFVNFHELGGVNYALRMVSLQESLLRQESGVEHLRGEAIRIHEFGHLIFSDTLYARSLSGENNIPGTSLGTGLFTIDNEGYLSFVREVQSSQKYLDGRAHSPLISEAQLYSTHQIKLRDEVAKNSIHESRPKVERNRMNAGLQEVFADFLAAVALKDGTIIPRILGDSPSQISFYVRNFEFGLFDELRRAHPHIDQAVAGNLHIEHMELRHLFWKHFYLSTGEQPGNDLVYDRIAINEMYKTLEAFLERGLHVNPEQASTGMAHTYLALARTRKFLGHFFHQARQEVDESVDKELSFYIPHQDAEFIYEGLKKSGLDPYLAFKNSPDYLDFLVESYGEQASLPKANDYRIIRGFYQNSNTEEEFNRALRDWRAVTREP